MYDDIINLERPISKAHLPMSIEARAAQFSPYAALVGHKDLIAEEEILAATRVNIGREIELELDSEKNALEPEP